MVTTGINFQITGDSSQALGEIERVKKEAEEAARNGNYAEAANLSRTVDNIQNSQRMGNVAQGVQPGIVGSAAMSTGNYQAITKLDTRLELLGRTIEELTEQLEENTKKGDYKASFNISAALNNAEQEKIRLEAEKKRLESEKNNGNNSELMDAIKKYGISRYATQALGTFNQVSGIGFAYRSAMANGDYANAGANALEGYSGVAQGLGGSLLGAGMMLGATPVGWGLMAAGGLLEIGGSIGKYIAGDEKADNQEAMAYERTLATSNALNKRFTNGGTWQGNAEKTESIMDNGRRYAQDTGMSTLELVELGTQFSRFGATSADNAMQQARQIALSAQATGTDASVITNFLGTARRYGDNSDVLGYASQARQAAGLTKAQNQEFLNSLQSVIEDGIANGYVKSTEDVSKTFTMFARLSNNNPLWQGEQAAARLRQMNSGITGATALQSTSDMIVASAANNLLEGKNISQRNALIGNNRATGTYIDTMLLMEQGTNPKMFGQIARNVQDMEGNNIAAQIERYKDIYKLNYAGAVDVYNMANTMKEGGMTEETFAQKIKAMQGDKNYQSEETKKQNAINKIDEDVRHIGHTQFNKLLAKLEGMASGKTAESTPAATVIATSASSEESAKAATEFVQENWTGANPSDLDPVIKTNLETSLATQALSVAANDYTGAVRAVMQPEKVISMMSGDQIANRTYDENNFAALLAEPSFGNNELDELFMNEIGNYAANAELKGWSGRTKHKADGVVDEGEVADAINAANNNRAMMKAYREGNVEEYTAAMEAMLKKLFGELVIKSE